MGSLILNSELYIKEHLLKYVIFQLEQGYSYGAIRDVLRKYGYSRMLVGKVMKSAQMHGYKTSRKFPGDIKELTDELHIYIMDMLVDFITKEMSVGYKRKQIKDALINIGHNETMVNEAFAKIKKKEIVSYAAKQIYFPLAYLFIFSLFASFLLFFLISYLTNTTIVEVYRHLSPGILTFALVALAMNVAKSRFAVRLIPLFSIIAAIGLFFFFKHIQVFNPDSDLNVLLALNIAVGFIFSITIAFLSFKNEVLSANELKEEKVNDPKIELKERLQGETLESLHLMEDTQEEVSPLEELKHAVVVSSEKRIPLKNV